MSTFVFLSYVREDSSLVDQLKADLEQHGISTWLDRQNLRPGQDWEAVICQTIAQSQFFIACFSHNFAKRQRSEMHAELRLAVTELRRRPPERLWFIPIKLSPCEVPAHIVTPPKTLRSYHTLELYPDWPAGLARLRGVLQGATLSAVSPADKTTNPVTSVADVTPAGANDQHIKIGQLDIDGTLTFTNESDGTGAPSYNKMSIEIEQAKASQAEFSNRRR